MRRLDLHSHKANHPSAPKSHTSRLKSLRQEEEEQELSVVGGRGAVLRTPMSPRQVSTTPSMSFVPSAGEGGLTCTHHTANPTLPSEFRSGLMRRKKQRVRTGLGVGGVPPRTRILGVGGRSAGRMRCPSSVRPRSCLLAVRLPTPAAKSSAVVQKGTDILVGAGSGGG